jgi:hypothetical protein
MNMRGIYPLIPWAFSKLSGRNIVMRSVPALSRLSAIVPGSNLADAFEQSNCDIKDASAIEIYFNTLKQTPKWVDGLLWIRNKTCKSLFGLKDVGEFASTKLVKPLHEYKTGDHLGIFTIVSVDQNEVVLEDNDKHLCVQISFLKQQETNSVTISSVVHVHNWSGKLYMLFVAPMHKLIVSVTHLTIPILKI